MIERIKSHLYKLKLFLFRLKSELPSVVKYLINRRKFKKRKNLALSMVNPAYTHFFLPIIDIYSNNKEYNIFCFGHRISDLDVYSKTLEKYITEPLIILCVDSHYYPPKDNRVRIQMFHGLASFGSIWGDVFLTWYDVIFLPGPYMKFQMSEDYYAGIIEENDIRCYDVGYPKLDLFNDLPDTGQSKAIFYGPTYHVDYSSIFKWLEIIFEIASTQGFQLVLKLHPFLSQADNYTFSGGVDWDKEIIKLSNRYNIVPRILTSDSPIVDQRESFACSDVFITDASGIGSEYALATGNPIIYLDDKIKIPPGSNKEEYREYFEVKKRGEIGPIVFSKDELIQAIEDITAGNPYSAALEQLREEFVFNLGCATDSAKHALDTEFARIEDH